MGYKKMDQNLLYYIVRLYLKDNFPYNRITSFEAEMQVDNRPLSLY